MMFEIVFAAVRRRKVLYSESCSAFGAVFLLPPERQTESTRNRGDGALIVPKFNLQAQLGCMLGLKFGVACLGDSLFRSLAFSS
jgi:hypothetical protein